MHADLQRLLAADLLPDVTAVPLDHLRRIRLECNAAEGDVSFVRRVVQGRLDIIGRESQRRTDCTGSASAAGAGDAARTGTGTGAGAGDIGTGTGDAGAGGGAGAGAGDDLSGLLFELPEILSSSSASGPTSRGGRVAIHEPGTLAVELVTVLDELAPASLLSSLDLLDAGRLTDLVDDLRTFEIELSATRRRLHERIDSIQGEVARRYRDGEASIDTLLN